MSIVTRKTQITSSTHLLSPPPTRHIMVTSLRTSLLNLTLTLEPSSMPGRFHHISSSKPLGDVTSNFKRFRELSEIQSLSFSSQKPITFSELLPKQKRTMMGPWGDKPQEYLAPWSQARMRNSFKFQPPSQIQPPVIKTEGDEHTPMHQHAGATFGGQQQTFYLAQHAVQMSATRALGPKDDTQNNK
ncbi:hypothetical protein AX16_010880 [Volvariella volvacea WC 439]|nr:hypothetical protein AX16_010880 [Volvariella volvacea WC 439]